MDPTQTEPIQPSRDDVTGAPPAPNPVSAAPLKEGQSVGSEFERQSPEQPQVSEYLQTSNPLPKPQGEVAKIVRVPENPDATLASASQGLPADNAASLQTRIREEKKLVTNDTSSSSNWKRILNIFDLGKFLARLQRQPSQV